MQEVSVSDLRRDLAIWIERARLGEVVSVSIRGEVVAQIVPVHDVREVARRSLLELRPRATVGDVESPLGDKWDADR